jgi:hypothetical protein
LKVTNDARVRDGDFRDGLKKNTSLVEVEFVIKPPTGPANKPGVGVNRGRGRGKASTTTSFVHSGPVPRHPRV